MVTSFIVGLLLGAVSVVFLAQNISTVTVTFFVWQLEGSLAVLLLLAIITGALITLLFLLPQSISNYFTYKRLVKVNVKLEDELRKQKELTVFAKTPPPTEADLKKLG